MAEAKNVALVNYTRHLAGCGMLASHTPHDLVCTCGRDAALALLTEAEARAVRAEAVVEAAREVRERHMIGNEWGPLWLNLRDSLAAYDAGQEGKPE